MSSTSAGVVSPASTYSNLFPTQTQGSGNNQNGNRGTPNVYYLVFLGVLVILMLIAGCLTLRAVRMRRRYRTATQIALARGEPIPEGMREDFWGLGGLSGWTAEGLDRLGNIRPGEEWVPGTGRRGAGKGRWEKVPVLYEGELVKEQQAEVERSGVGGDEVWDHVRPLTLLSLRPSQTPFPDESSDPPVLTPVRNMGPRPRPAPMFTFSRHRSSSYGVTDQAQSSTSRSQQQQTTKEIDREIVPGEEVRLGVVIQMPVQGLSERQRTREGDDDDEEEVAWENGMELGVWEGVLAGDRGQAIENGRQWGYDHGGKRSLDSLDSE
ncbi:hypothetical protein CI109_105318 [Kwoniella shandongensis]|uniref:Uncharacterized protein n=1 Tax=Kwoniella shandongensis TaxID=1734106 RepID=A0A5M6BWE9_9TREE|nr:uncharacterized protein CI109_005001 [Kwoniella shandongensis]KAA5526611.1 hypothetical protein CI109_005001 [Kwoniella shandongensis]